MKTMKKILGFSFLAPLTSSFVSAQTASTTGSYYDFSILAETLTNLTEVLSVLGSSVIPAILPVIVALAILSAIVTAITVGVSMLMGWLKLKGK